MGILTGGDCNIIDGLCTIVNGIQLYTHLFHCSLSRYMVILAVYSLLVPVLHLSVTSLCRIIHSLIPFKTTSCA
jgi:hypothetical protein